MKTKETKNSRSEQEIDRIVEAQVDDESLWGKPVLVRKTKKTSLSIPSDLAARAAFLSQLHRIKSVDDWLARIIQERIELEEAAYAGVKQALMENHTE